MASILLLKRRIQASQNVSKTTKAMQMIAASKMKRAQEAALATRPYVAKLMSMTGNIVSKIDEGQKINHPYIREDRLTNKTLILVLSPDKGLCGGLVTNLVREFLTYNKTEKDSYFLTVGKKIESQIAHRGSDVVASFTFGNTTPKMEMVYPIIRIIDEYYTSKKVDSVKILTTHFTSIFSQTPKITNILPITIPEQTQEKTAETLYTFEPSLTEMLPSLLKHYLETTVYQHLLESFVSEQAARMIAMQNATDNANGIIEDLKLEYNKTRQAKITSEILDISSAAITATV